MLRSLLEGCDERQCYAISQQSFSKDLRTGRIPPGVQPINRSKENDLMILGLVNVMTIILS
jgi:hypothetical protein